jgi:glycosyltransferase involved in cell wall biosynthesis
MKPLFVLLITYRRVDKLKETIESLKTTLPDGSQITIIDNHSDDGTWNYLSQDFFTDPYFAAHQIVTAAFSLEKNIGFGGAVNEGLRIYPEWREYEYVLESNNDVWYKPDWFEKATGFMQKYPKLGLLGLWKHPYHGVQRDDGDVLIKDDMPAVAWLLRSKDLVTFLPFPEHGPTQKRGGNSEDSTFVQKIQGAGFEVGGPTEDLAEHMDGYDTDRLGKDNEEYL